MPLFRRRAVREDAPKSARIPIARQDQDQFITAIITWIPIEVIAVYKFVVDLIPLEYTPWRLHLTVLILILTPLWIAFATVPKGKEIAWRQVILAPFAFVCWVAAIQQDVVVSLFDNWQSWMGSMVLGVGTLLLPIIDGMMKRLCIPQN